MAAARLFFQVLLFALGPFYAYPWKPIVHKYFGDSYQVALAHFKKGHYGVTNLTGHMVCLFMQVIGNFGLLRVLDEKVIPQPIAGVRLLSLQTAASWSLYLFVASAAPFDVKLLSAVAIFAGYSLAPFVQPGTYELVAVASYVAALTFADLVLSKKKIGISGYLKVAALPAMVVAWSVISATYAGALRGQSGLVTAGVASVLIGLAAIPNPIKKVVIAGMITCRLASIVTGSEELFWLGYAFSASFFQGVAHLATREEATLIALGNKGGHDELSSEWAHVVYFPCLLLQTVRDKLFPPVKGGDEPVAPQDAVPLSKASKGAASTANMRK